METGRQQTDSEGQRGEIHWQTVSQARANKSIIKVAISLAAEAEAIAALTWATGKASAIGLQELTWPTVPIPAIAAVAEEIVLVAMKLGAVQAVERGVP